MSKPAFLSLTILAAALAAGLAPAAAQAPAPAAAAAAHAMSSEEVRTTVRELADLLEGRFVFPETARRYAAMLREKLAAGAYDGLTDPEVFARTVTADLQATAHDGHLRVMTGAPEARRFGGPGAPAQAIEDARWIADGVAYLRLNVFPNDPKTVAAVRKFMAEHAHARTLILDARVTRGGTLDVPDTILPYLFDHDMTLLRMDTRAAAEAAFGGGPDIASLVDRPSTPDLVRRDHTVRPLKGGAPLAGAKVFYLTSKRTGSAAEHLALALKRTHRATLIGESTAGAGHFGALAPVGRFSVFVPVGRTYDPDTGEGWEAKGVAPDIAVPADQALDKALELAGVKTRA